MKKLIALVLAVFMLLSLVACDTAGAKDNTDEKTVKVGLICIGDENDQGYTYTLNIDALGSQCFCSRFLAADKVVVKYNILENSGCEDANIELADDGCSIIINNSYGHEP